MLTFISTSVRARALNCFVLRPVPLGKRGGQTARHGTGFHGKWTIIGRLQLISTGGNIFLCLRFSTVPVLHVIKLLL